MSELLSYANMSTTCSEASRRLAFKQILSKIAGIKFGSNRSGQARTRCPTRAAVGMGIPMGMGMVWVWGL